jgi:hypothetical protein
VAQFMDVLAEVRKMRWLSFGVVVAKLAMVIG